MQPSETDIEAGRGMRKRKTARQLHAMSQLHPQLAHQPRVTRALDALDNAYNTAGENLPR